MANSKSVFQQVFASLRDNGLTKIEHPKSRYFSSLDFKALIRNSAPYAPRAPRTSRPKSESASASASTSASEKENKEKEKDNGKE
jgi:hypothetical protein